MPVQKTVIIIAGPTAVGKTAVAISLAKHFATEIISADSRQCYKEMNIGVARPSPEELAQVPHHFIASHSIFDKINAAGFEQYALQKTNEILQKKDVVVMVGGTGLYIKAFCEGLDEIPEVPEMVRKQVAEQYTQHGLAWLQKEVALVDPQFYKEGEVLNPHRLLRALEVFKTTGKSIQEYKKRTPKERLFRIIKTGLELPKEQLLQNINNRVNDMMNARLPEEVHSLIPNKHLPALQTVGYLELFNSFEGKLTLEKAIEEIKIHTRQYAKRQLTWFKKDKEFEWFSPLNQNSFLSYVQKCSKD
jgi:tRNA dimethylallyltransferase